MHSRAPERRRNIDGDMGRHERDGEATQLEARKAKRSSETGSEVSQCVSVETGFPFVPEDAHVIRLSKLIHQVKAPLVMFLVRGKFYSGAFFLSRRDVIEEILGVDLVDEFIIQDRRSAWRIGCDDRTYTSAENDTPRRMGRGIESKAAQPTKRRLRNE